jgi:hypothetical protein
MIDDTVLLQADATPKFEKKGRRINSLRHRITWIESHGYHNKVENLKQLKEEYAELLEADEKADKLRNLNLISCKITKFLFVCNNCFDRLSKRRKTL